MVENARLVVVADDAGNVVAGHHIGEATGAYVAGMGVLAGQSLHEVDLPAELASADKHEVLRGIFAYRVEAGTLVRKEG
jgi:hypothetical protein